MPKTCETVTPLPGVVGVVRERYHSRRLWEWWEWWKSSNHAGLRPTRKTVLGVVPLDGSSVPLSPKYDFSLFRVMGTQMGVVAKTVCLMCVRVTPACLRVCARALQDESITVLSREGLACVLGSRAATNTPCYHEDIKYTVFT